MQKNSLNSKTALIFSGAMTAGGTGDNTLITSDSTETFLGFNSVKIAVGAKATLASGATLKIVKANLETSANGSDWTLVSTIAEDVTLGTGASGGSTNAHLTPFEFDVDRSKLNAKLRVLITPDLSAANTDTAIISGYVIGYDAYENPVSRG
jgi:hypothetical protein